LARRTLPQTRIGAFPLLRLVAGLLVRRMLPLTRPGVFPLLRLVAGLLFRRTLLLPRHGSVLVGNVEVRTKRPHSKSAKAVYFSSLTLITHASSVPRVAAESCRVKRIGAHEPSTFKVDEGSVLVEKVEVRTKRPRSKSTKAIYFSSLTFLMAGRKRPRGCSAANVRCSILVAHVPQAAADRVKDFDPLESSSRYCYPVEIRIKRDKWHPWP